MTARDDRQVLVVGDGAAGLSVTAILQRAGYDPVLLATGDPEPPSLLATLYPVGRSLFDRLAPESTRSTDPSPVDLDGIGTSGTDSPVGVAADNVDAGLAKTVPGDAIRADGLGRLERDGDALRVRFESGVREWFDLVVAADGPASTVREARERAVDTVDATQVETRVETESVSQGRVSWTDDGLLEALPFPGGDTLVRVTTDSLASDSPERRLRRTLDRAGIEVSGSLDPVTRTVTQARGDGVWADDRVAYCGGAAFPQAPATGLRTTLALVDARVLADELLAGPSSVATAVTTYDRRRRRHVRALRESTPRGPASRAVTAADDPLAAVRRDRLAGLGSREALAGVDHL